MKETHSLKLEDDDDEILLEALEEAFEVRFVPAEVAKLRTVGDLFDLLQAKMGTMPQRRKRCLSAVSFYRLKKAVAEATGLSVTPRMAIADVFPAETLHARIRALGEKTGLRLPAVRLAQGQCLLFLFGAASCLAALSFGLMTRSGMTALVIGLCFFYFLRLAEFPRSMAPHSFGDLARETAFRNYGRLARETGTHSSVDLWQALDFMIRDSLAFDGKIARETRLA